MDLYSVAEQMGLSVYISLHSFIICFISLFWEEKLNETDGIVVQRGNF